MKSISAKGRDNARTPFQWDESEHAGFTTGTPWIKVNPNYKEINAKQAMADPDSIFHYYRKLIQLRKQYPIIVYGNYDLLLPEDEKIYAYTRTLGVQKLLVVLNFTADSPVFESELEFSAHQLLISNYHVDEKEPINRIVLRPYEARVYLLQD
jgi:oligo-1,6-glucosidase